MLSSLLHRFVVPPPRTCVVEWALGLTDVPLAVAPPQMFFEVSVFTAFVDACRAIGITCPIIPGIMLVQNAGGFGRMTAFCKSRVPAELKRRVEACADSKACRAVGIEWATDMCRSLIKAGVLGLHFYTLNLEAVLKGVLKNLGLLVEDVEAEATAADDAATQAKGTILDA